MADRTLKDVTDAEAVRQLMAAKGSMPLKECCRVLRLLQSLGLRHMYVFHGDRRFEAAKLNYCPECGRKL